MPNVKQTIFLLILFVFMIPAQIQAAANTPYVTMTSPTTAQVFLNAGNDQIEVAEVVVQYDPAHLSVSTCEAGPEFEGIGQQACTIDATSGIVTISEDAIAVDGATGTVLLGTINFTADSAQPSLTIRRHEITASAPNGSLVLYQGAGATPTITPVPTVRINFMGIKLGDLHNESTWRSFFDVLLSW